LSQIISLKFGKITLGCYRGEETIGQGNLGGVARLRRIPARRSGGGSVSWGERRGKAAGERGSTRFCSNARFVGEKEREREITRLGAERRAAPTCPTGRRGSRSGRLPDVEERGTASEGNAGGGRRDRATCGARSEGRRAAGRRSGPGEGGGVQQRRRQREDRDWGRQRRPGCKEQKTQGPHCNV
jgi:hypothetical protein